jgi:hypothetical protein
LAGFRVADYPLQPTICGVKDLAIALIVGRAKDHTRILALLEDGAATRDQVAEVANRHGLNERWQGFVARFLDAP